MVPLKGMISLESTLMPRDTPPPDRLKEAELERASWRRRTLLLEVTRGGWHEKEETDDVNYLPSRNLTAKAPENKPSQKERIIFQPSFFRGELLNFWGVYRIHMQK